MIRKMLVRAAAIAMPSAAMAGVTAVGGPGIASAKALPPVAITCGLGGTVTFANPGLSYNGSLTNKTVEDTKTDVTLVGGDAACPTKAIKNKIVYTPAACATDPSPAPECALASVKTLAKDPNFYDTSTEPATTTLSKIVAGLAAGIRAVNNGTRVTLQVTPPNSSDIFPGGVCGTEFGFAFSGGVTNGGASVSHYALNICLTGDSGASTSGDFFTDLVASAGGNTAIVIAGSTLGAGSTLTYS